MRAATGWILGTVVIAAVAAGAWLLARSGADEEGGLGSTERAPASEAGPALVGKVRTPDVPLATEGRFEIPVLVLDEAGNTLSGVRITVRRRGDAYPWWDARRAEASQATRRAALLMRPGPGSTEPFPVVAEGVSGADGTATLVVTRRGDYEVRAEPEAPRTSAYGGWYLAAQAPTRTVVLRVLGGSRLHGRVVDAEGRGVQATLTTTRSDGSVWLAPPVSSAAATGAFAFDAVPKGRVSIWVLIPGRVHFMAATVTTPHEGEVLIRLDPGATVLAGHVRTVEGGSVAGAHVVARVRAGAVEVTYLAVSDAEGAYELVGPFGGPLQGLDVTAQGFVGSSASIPLAPWSGLEVGPGRSARLDVVLYKGGVLEGRVLDASSGAPLAGARVALYPVAADARVGEPPHVATMSDAQGRYGLEGVAIGSSLAIVSHPSHHQPALEALRGNRPKPELMRLSLPPPPDLLVFVAREGQRVQRDFRLVAGVPVRGRVVDGAGQPIEGAEIVSGGMTPARRLGSWTSAHFPRTEPRATSDADGRFEIAGLAPHEEWTLLATKPPLVSEESAPFAVRAGEAVPEVTLRVLAGGVLAGRVVDREDRPARGVIVWYMAHVGSVQHVTSDADGTFRIGGLNAGPFQLSASGEGASGSASHQGKSLEPGEVREGIELKLESQPAKLVEVRGSLVHEDGTPAPHRPLVLEGRSGLLTSTTSDERGAFEFKHVAEGPATLYAGTQHDRTRLEVVSAPSSDVRIVYREAATAVVEGHVLDAAGAPVPLCSVSVRTLARPARGEGGPGGQEPEPVANGWFRRHVKGAAPYLVSVSAPQDEQGRPLNLMDAQVEVVDAKAPVTIRLEPGLEVRGQVKDEGGRGVAGVHLVTSGGATQSDATGAFRLVGLKEAEVAVQVVVPAAYVKVPVLRARAGDHDVIVRVTRGFPIAGEVKYSDGSKPEQARVMVAWGPEGRPDGVLEALVGKDGRFRVEGVPAGETCTVSVQAWSLQGGEPPTPPLEDVRAGTESLVILLARGVRVAGLAVDADGKPLRRGGVDVEHLDPNARGANYVRIQPDGTFVTYATQSGARLRLWVRGDGGIL